MGVVYTSPDLSNDKVKRLPPLPHLPLFVIGLQDQVPAAPPGPSSPAQATLHHQEAQYLLLDAGPPCPLVYPNKLLGETGVLRLTCFFFAHPAELNRAQLSYEFSTLGGVFLK